MDSTYIKNQLKMLDQKMKDIMEIDDFNEFLIQNYYINRERNRILKMCDHKIDEIPENRDGYVECIHCEQLFWFCNDSPNNVCDYDDDDDPIHDNCLHCGLPEERK